MNKKHVSWDSYGTQSKTQSLQTTLKEASQPFESKWNILKEIQPPPNGPELIKNRLAAVEIR